MADRPFKVPKKEGPASASSSSSTSKSNPSQQQRKQKQESLSSSVLKQQPPPRRSNNFNYNYYNNNYKKDNFNQQEKNKSRSPILTRSRSKIIDDSNNNNITTETSPSINNNTSTSDHLKNNGAINRSSKRTLKSTTATPVESNKKIKVTTGIDPKTIPTAGASSSAVEPIFTKSKLRSQTQKPKTENQNQTSTIRTRTQQNKRPAETVTQDKETLQSPRKKSAKIEHSSKKSKKQSEASNLKANKSNSDRRYQQRSAAVTATTSTTNSHSNRIVMDQNGGGSNNHLSSTSSSSNGLQQSTNTVPTSSNSSNNNDSSSQIVNPGTSAIMSSYSINSTQSIPSDETDDSDMNRLQTILESRISHQHFLGIPRMQNLFYRSFSNSSNTKAQQLLNSLNSAASDSEKLHYVLEMCQILLMGNEDTLVGFPIKAVVPTLINLLSMEHNFEIMHHACRALTYMMESLPRSSVVVLEAIPVFLEKLQVIQCMDVAEQSLSALEMLSRRHNKAILQARGVSACLTYLDFFSIDAQRSALTITANCFQNLTPDDFQYVQESLPILGSHLTIEDKKCIESICLAFYRLVECYQSDCVIISEIASTELLTNIQNVLMTIPPVLSTGSFVNVIRMLSIMCLSCSQIAVELLKLNICETLKCLLLSNDGGNGSSQKDKTDCMNLISRRSPQEICELTSFIAELMPSLPLNGIFSIDLLFSKSNQVSSEIPLWQWKDDRGIWQPFNVVDNKIIESAHQSGEDELELASLNRTYIVDFNAMQKICEDTGNSYAIQRKTNICNNSEILNRSNMQQHDPRSEFIYKEQKLTSNFVKFVFKVLYEVYNNSAGYSVRYKCLNAILRIIYYAPKDLLQSILEDQSISSSIATMLASHDIRIVVCAVQMCNILMEKMPEIFSIYFQREGVIHQMRKLYSDDSRFNEKSRDFFHQHHSKICGSANNQQIVYTTNSPIVLENAQMLINRSNNDSLQSTFECFAAAAAAASGTNSGPATTAGANFSSITQPQPNSASVVTKSSSNNNSSSLNKSNSVQNSDQLSGRNEEISKRKRTRKSTAFSTGRNSSSLNNYATDGIVGSENNNNSSSNPENDLNIYSGLSTTYLNNLPFLVSETINAANLNNLSNHKNSTRLGSSKDFLQRLNPTRWARWAQSSVVNPNSNVIPTTSNVTTAVASKDLQQQKTTSNNKDKIKSWIKEQGKIFDEKYFIKTDSNEKDSHITSNILCDLKEAIQLLKQDTIKGLGMIKNILLDSDLSSFELIHSGLVKTLLSFLIKYEQPDSQQQQEQNLRTFLHLFIGSPLNEMEENVDQMNFDPKPFSILVNKLNACVSQLEQFPIRVQDYSYIVARGSHPFKFLSSHFFKISLNRHPSCTNLKKYKGPLIKLDPLTPVQSIERYLLTRGYGKIKDNDDDQSDEEFSDDDSLEMNATSSSSSHLQTTTSSVMQQRHRLQLLIGEHVLPYNMPLFQAIKQFMSNDLENLDSDSDNHLSNSKLWSSTFFIYYRMSTDSSNNNNSSMNIVNTTTSSSSSSSAVSSTTTTAATTSTSARGSRRNKNSKTSTKKKDELWLEGKLPKNVSPLDAYLKNGGISINVLSINDQSSEVIQLLRVLYGINRYWGHLYRFAHVYQPVIPMKEFVNNKLAVKANRQLQDPVVIMTGTLPSWLSQLAYACPFMFPFEVRYLLFYVACFDRDRAIHRLFENTPDLSSLIETRERLLVPRLEKRKKLISRNDIFRSAETLFNDVSNSKSMLEIHYENEVGTGLGPTLEFYALVSKEFQRAELEMWRGEVLNNNNNVKNDKNGDNHVNYIQSNYGLFPLPLGRQTKPATATKIKQRFKLLGKFMAKALMDSRMIDINLNIIFYKWLLNEESSLSVSDLYHLDYAFFQSISQMYRIALRKSKMNVNTNPELFEIQGCSIEDLNLDFIMPGYPNIELLKGGKDLPVTLNNLENYIDLVSFWSLVEGVTKQMEAFKEGFNSVFDLSHLKLFYPEELQQLFCGSNYKSWDFKMLMESCKTDHGFTHDSKAIKFLFEILSSYNDEEQRKFLQFLTGFPRLPIGGFKSLNPAFTIVKKSPTESDNPNCLPSVMTCVNYLKLPDYPTIEMMREKLKIAINEGRFSFHLS